MKHGDEQRTYHRMGVIEEIHLHHNYHFGITRTGGGEENWSGTSSRHRMMKQLKCRSAEFLPANMKKHVHIKPQLN